MIGCTGWTGYCLDRNGHNSLGWYTRGPYPYLSGSPPFTKGGHSLTNINSDFQSGMIDMSVVLLPQFLAPEIAPSCCVLPVTFSVSVSVYVTQALPSLRGLNHLYQVQ